MNQIVISAILTAPGNQVQDIVSKYLPLVPTIFTALATLLGIISTITGFMRSLLQRIKQTVNYVPFKIVEIKHEPLEHRSWIKQKRFYFYSFLTYCIFLFITFFSYINSSVDTNVAYPVIGSIFSINFIYFFFVSLFTAFLFYWYRLMGKKPEDARYVFFSEVEMKVNMDKQSFLYYLQGILNTMHVYTFDFTISSGLLEACIKRSWYPIPAGILKFQVQDAENGNSLVRISATSTVFRTMNSSAIINNFIKSIIPKIGEDTSKNDVKHKNKENKSILGVIRKL